LSSTYRIPHGHAVALTLGRIASHIATSSADKVIDPRGKQHVRDVLTTIMSLVGVESGDQLERWWYDYMEACGLETNPTKLGMVDADTHVVVDGVNMERLSNHPTLITRDELRCTLLPR
jgi:alcohol dehydrogenase class IV